MKKILLILILFSFKVSFSQLINPPSDIKSPTASSLGKYGDVPVSHYNGTTNISIPLYSINEEEIPLGISLNYDSSGVRVNSVASWVGQNWSLNAGGVITRTIRGKVDLRNRNFTWGRHAQANKGFKYTGHRLNTSNWTTISNLNNLIAEANVWNAPNNYRDMDLEPDIFTFNFMGIQGKFFLGNDGEWKVHSNTRLKIKAYERLAPDFRVNAVFSNYVRKNDIGQIVITDTKGVRYIFGSTNNHIEYSIPFRPEPYGRLTTERPNAWYLSSIVNSKNQTIYTFDYERGDKIVHFYRRNGYSKGVCEVVGPQGFSYTGVGSNKTYEHLYNGTIIFPVHLKTIQTKNGDKITFNSSVLTDKPFNPLEYPLRMIGRGPLAYTSHPLLQGQNDDFNARFEHFNPYTVSVIPSYNSKESQQKRIEHLINQLNWKKLNSINVSNYNNKIIKSINLNYNPTTNNHRLNLKSIDETSSSNQLINLYSFEYDSFNELPGYLSKKVDKWGFYNGVDYIVREYIFWENGGNPPSDNFFSEHEPSRNADENYVKKGMLTKIIYPTKGFSSFDYEAHKATKKVNNNKQLVSFSSQTPIGGVRIKRIEKNSGSSENEIITYQYDGGILHYEPKFFNPNWLGSNSIGASYIFNINSLIPLSNINGNYIGYSKVTEKYNNNSQIVYKFSDYNMYPDIAYEGTLNTEQSIFNKSSDKSLLRGKLTETQKLDNQGTIKEKTIREYLNVNNTPYSNKYVRAFEYTSPVCSNTTGGFGNAYKLFYMDYAVIKETTETYFDTGQTMSSYVDYKYNDDFLVSEISTLNSDNYKLTQKYKYPKDFIFEETVTHTNTGDPNEIQHIDGEVTYKNVYAQMVDKNMINYPIEVIKSNNHNVLSSQVVSYKKASGIINKSKYNKSENFLDLPLDFSGAKADNLNELNIDGRLKERLFYDRYDDRRNLEMYHKKDELFTVLIWGYKKTQIIAKIDNISNYSDVSSYISNLQNLSNLDDDRTIGTSGKEGDLRSALNNLRNVSTLSKSQITTYTYDPLIGITSITDIRGETVYYQYDNFNKLQYVKDSNGNILSENQYNYKN